MKLITIEYPDSTNLTGLIKGSTVAVSDGTTTVSPGILLAISDVLDPPVTAPALPPHTHTESGGETGAANPT